MKQAYSLLLILDRDLPNPARKPYDKTFDTTSLYFNTGTRLLPLSLREVSRLRYAVDETLDVVFRSDVFSKEIAIPLIEKRIGKKYCDALCSMKKKMDYTILINSFGGGHSTQGFIEHSIELIKLKGGTVRSFTFLHALSAAEEVFALTDYRCCLKFSKFMCHRGVVVGETSSLKKELKIDDSILRKLEFEDHEKSLQRLFERHHAKYDSKIKDLIHDTLLKPKDSLFLSGYLMEQWGMLDRAFHSFSEYLPVIEKYIGENAMKNKKVKALLNKMEKEYEYLLRDNHTYTARYPYFTRPLNNLEKLMKEVFSAKTKK